MNKYIASIAVALALWTTSALADRLYRVGDLWQAPSQPTVVEKFDRGLDLYTGNTSNWRWHTQPLAASPSGQQVYDNILTGTSTWALKSGCVGAWDAMQPSSVPAVATGPMPCATITSWYDGSRWHSGMIATTNPDGTPISSNLASYLGNRFSVQVLARLPDAITGQVATGLTPAIWINNTSSAAGSCTHEFDVVEAGGPYYHTQGEHCWLNGVDQHNAAVSVQDIFTATPQNVVTSDLTNWHFWGFQKTATQHIWTRDGIVTMVEPANATNRDANYDFMIAVNQIGCCGWPTPTDTTLRPQGWIGGFAIWQ